MEAPLAKIAAPARPPVARPAFPPRSAPHAPRAPPRGHAPPAAAPPAYRPPPRQERDRVLPTSVLVTGYPPYTKPQDLAHVFCQFGDVRLNFDWITDTSACLEFGTPDQARAAIAASRAVNIYGAFLTVKQCTVNTRPQRQAKRREQRIKQNSKGTIVEPTNIPLQGTFQQQLDSLLRCVRLSQAELDRLSVLYADIEAVLGSVWPGCRAYPFGSVTTGLGVKSSDADCFVLLPNANHAANAVPRARRLLQQHPQVFAELLAIPRANTPIVKFLHLPTRVYCDLSFKTLLGSRNSKLIAFLLFSDPRLVPFAVVVKYWARVHDLSGTGKLTNYALTMLIIFYLQQPPRHILPAVRWLQRDRADAYYVDYWNTGFMNDPRRLPPVADVSSVAELLGGFFRFYSEFDFERYAVCPFLGRPIPKNDFRDFDVLPDEFALYKNNVAGGYTMPLRFMTPMCVQDPFEQCHNVASPVTPRLASDVCAFFKFAADAYETEKSKDHAGFLRTILLQKPKLTRGNNKCTYRVKLPRVMIGSVPAADWKAAVREVALQIFTYILKIPLEREDGETLEDLKVATKTEGKENAKPEKGQNRVEKGTPKKETKKPAKPQATEAVKPEANDAVKTEPHETVKLEVNRSSKLEINGIDKQEVATKTEGKENAKPEKGQNRVEKGTPKKETKKPAKPQATEAVKPEANDAVKTEPHETVKLDVDKRPKPEMNGIDTQEGKKIDHSEGKDIPKVDATGAAKKVEKIASKLHAGITRKEKEAYTGELTRAIWKRKTFTKHIYNVMSLKFPEREAMITDEILNTDKNVITCGFRVRLTFNNAPRGAVVTLNYMSGEIENFKELGKFITSNYNNWFIALFRTFCKDGPNNKVHNTQNDVNNEEDSDTDSDTDSYEDERIELDIRDNSKQKPNNTESRDDYSKMNTIIDKDNKDKTNDSVKMFFNSILSNANKLQSNENKPVVQKIDKNENPPEKSPKKTKNRSPRHKKGKEKTVNDAGEPSGNSNSAVVNDQTP